MVQKLYSSHRFNIERCIKSEFLKRLLFIFHHDLYEVSRKDLLKHILVTRLDFQSNEPV
jgi:hypothetical protein